MNYLEQWTFFPDLAAREKLHSDGYHYDVIKCDDVMAEGTVGAGLSHLSTVYYNKSALDKSRESMPFDSIKRAFEDAMRFGTGSYRINWEFQNSLPKPSLPYYPLNV